MTARRNTKEAVAKAALRLFAEHGYDGVSMRDIAAAVDVKPASLYKHFSGKQALFDAVVERMDAAYERFAASLGTPSGEAPQLAGAYAALPIGAIADMAEAQFRYWTQDEEAVLYRRLLTREQYRDAAMGAHYRGRFADGPIAYHRPRCSTAWCRPGRSHRRRAAHGAGVLRAAHDAHADARRL